MIHNAYHSAFGTFDYENDEKEAKLTLVLTALMAVVTVALILWAIFQPSAGQV
jgi:hypothetical protein